MFIAAVTLLHVLVFVYWLGADLGSFYSSTILIDSRQSTPARMAAARVLENVDMAPRTALILAFPTGASLAAAKGWLTPAVSQPLLPLAWAGALIWLWIAWRIHHKHLPSGHGLRRLDLAIRWVVLISLVVGAGLGTLGVINLALFIRLKLTILAAAIGAGLAIRRLIAPLGPAFMTMAASGATPQTDAVITGALSKVRPVVLGLWVLILVAAFVGLATPT